MRLLVLPADLDGFLSPLIGDTLAFELVPPQSIAVAPLGAQELPLVPEFGHSALLRVPCFALPGYGLGEGPSGRGQLAIPGAIRNVADALRGASTRHGILVTDERRCLVITGFGLMRNTIEDVLLTKSPATDERRDHDV